MRVQHRLALCLLTAFGLAAVASADSITQLPYPAHNGTTVAGSIDIESDVESFGVFLGAGETLTVSAREASPLYGLRATLALKDPSGADVAITVNGQTSQKASFTFVATQTGLHTVMLTGDPVGPGGTTGTYAVSFGVTRIKPAKTTFAVPAGGALQLDFNAPDGTSVAIAASTKAGGFDLIELRRPDGTPEPAFVAAIKAKGRTKATVKKFALTGGPGAYSLRGNYDAGSSVAVSLVVSTNEKKETRKLGTEEPSLDPGQRPFPGKGIPGTVIRIVGTGLDDIPVVKKGRIVGHIYPTFRLGDIVVPAATVTHPNGSVFQFTVPMGVETNKSYDVYAFNRDGQGSRLPDAFFVVPAPIVDSITSLSGPTPLTDVGPAGGRKMTVFGQNLRAGSTFRFGTNIAQSNTGNPPNSLDVIAPAHAPGHVDITMIDEFGQSASVPGGVDYISIPSNTITSIHPASIQAVGGEKVTVNGVDFGLDTVLTLDGAPIQFTRVSSTVLEFVAAPHADSMSELRVTDVYGQTSAVPAKMKGFINTTEDAIPAPLTTDGSVEGWRSTRVLSGRLDGNASTDLVLLRPEKAFGADADRSRIRLLFNNGTGTFTDRTATRAPAVSGDEDWRAKDGVLTDIDGDGDLDLAIITDELISDGARPSLRVLKNDGNGVFTDATAASVPAVTGWLDHCQGIAIAAANMDGANRNDLVILHTGYFSQTFVTPGEPPVNPDDPPTPDIVETFYYPGTRVLLNNGSGVFAHKVTALPAITDTSPTQYQGDALVVGDVNGAGGPDILITRFEATNLARAAWLLSNNGSATFTDVSAAKLPAASDPEYLQADRVYLADSDGDSDLDIFLTSVSRQVSPVTSEVSPGSALRLLINDGSGGFDFAAAGTLPDLDGNDANQCNGLVVSDLTGDGKPEIVMLSTHAPIGSDRAMRLFVKQGPVWQRGSQGLPDPVNGDDLRGADVIATDVDSDGITDLVFVRDEGDNSVRSTLVLVNPR